MALGMPYNPILFHSLVMLATMWLQGQPTKKKYIWCEVGLFRSKKENAFFACSRAKKLPK